MKTVILCGGFGTRIRDVSDELPKPMIPVGSYPILWHLMKYYASFGHTEFILCLGYKGQVIKDFFLNYEANMGDFTINLGEKISLEFYSRIQETNWKITFADTGTEALTGARVRKIKKYIGDDEDFMMTYGDGLSNIDLNELGKFHRRHGKILTVTGVRPPGRFGELVSRGDGVISEFNEKPQTTDGRISGGFFMCKRRVFDFLDDREDLIFEQEPVKALVKNKEAILFEHDGFWQCMDTNRDWQYLNEIFRAGKAPWVKW